MAGSCTPGIPAHGLDTNLVRSCFIGMLTCMQTASSQSHMQQRHGTRHTPVVHLGVAQFQAPDAEAAGRDAHLEAPHEPACAARLHVCLLLRIEKGADLQLSKPELSFGCPYRPECTRNSSQSRPLEVDDLGIGPIHNQISVHVSASLPSSGCACRQVCYCKAVVSANVHGMRHVMRSAWLRANGIRTLSMPAPDRAWPNNRSLTCCAALVLAGPPPQSKGGPATRPHARCMQVPARIAALQRRHCMALALKLPLTLTRSLPSFVLTVLASVPTMTLTVTQQLHLDQSTPLSDLRADAGQRDTSVEQNEGTQCTKADHGPQKLCKHEDARSSCSSPCMASLPSLPHLPNPTRLRGHREGHDLSDSRHALSLNSYASRQRLPHCLFRTWSQSAIAACRGLLTSQWGCV